MDALLLVERGDWFGASALALLGVHRLEGNRLRELALLTEDAGGLVDNGLDHVATLVHFADDVGCLPAHRGLDGAGRPGRRAHPPGEVFEHVPVPILSEAEDHDAGLVRCLCLRCGGVDSDDNFDERREDADEARLEDRAGPECSGGVVEDEGLELLLPEPGALVPLDQLADVGIGKIALVLVRRAVRERGLRVLDQPTDQSRRPGRRRGYNPRVPPEAQPELQLVPGVFVPPRRDLIGTCAVVLLAAETIWLLGGVKVALGAVWPDEPQLRRLVDRREPGRGDREDAALSLDEDVADIARRGADQRLPSVALRANGIDRPLAQGARLAEPAACEEQPCPPVPGGRELLGPGPERPIVKKCSLVRFRRRQEAELLLPLRGGQQAEQLGERLAGLHSRPRRLRPSPRGRRTGA